MKHCIFCSATRMVDDVRRAMTAMNICDTGWFLEHDCIMQKYHSDFTMTTEMSNTSIWLENEDVHQLIKDCMEFSATQKELKMRNDNAGYFMPK